MPSLKISEIFVAINMTNEDWAISTSAPIMLAGLYLQDPVHFKTLAPKLHRYFLSCCWKIKHLIPQKGLREGLRGAEKWIDGEITDTEFWRLEYIAEADAFAFENVESPEEIEELKSLIASVDMLKDVSYDIAHQILMEAAYFTNSAMVYPALNTVPYDERLCTSIFLCPELLRKHIQPNLHGVPYKGSLDIVPQVTPLRTALGKIKGPLPKP